MKRELVLGVSRERRFSPGKVEDDAAILSATAERLRERGIEVRVLDGDEPLPREVVPALVFSMQQGEVGLAWLD
ncbi:MAG: hypothetical protein ACREQJ_00490, partial [Candidatus Binatia bacterium]